MNNIKKQMTLGSKFALGAFIPMLLVVGTHAQSIIQGQVSSASAGANGASSVTTSNSNPYYNQNYNNNNSNGWGTYGNNYNWNNWNSYDVNSNNDLYNYVMSHMGNLTNQQKISQLTTLVSLLNQKITQLRSSTNGQGYIYSNGWYH